MTWVGELDPRGFDPRSHVGSDDRLATVERAGEVSIHAPTWGATYCDLSAAAFEAVSIHAPTWGATTMERSAE